MEKNEQVKAKWQKKTDEQYIFGLYICKVHLFTLFTVFFILTAVSLVLPFIAPQTCVLEEAGVIFTITPMISGVSYFTFID